MSTKSTPQSHWYCPSDVTRQNLQLHCSLQKRVNMTFKKWKSIRIGLTTLGVFLLAVFSVENGADPGQVFWGSILLIALLNGIDVAEMLAVYLEVTGNSPASGEASDPEPRKTADTDRDPELDR